MEVVIFGTKGGYRTLFKTSGAPAIGSEIRNNVGSEAALGKFAYSIAFVANGCLFTKYIILRDTLRNNATGFLAFSLYVSKDKSLLKKGADVKFILDQLSDRYLELYVRDNCINRGENDLIIQEDWSYVNNVLIEKLEVNSTERHFEVSPGTMEAAYIFYEDDLKLQEYFTKPFQEEYIGYKQILLISEKLRNTSFDLLNVLRNSGVELRVDLNNEEFYLKNFDPTSGLIITSNNKIRNGGKNNNIIRRKDKIVLEYTKKYYTSMPIQGTLSDPNSLIFRFLEIVDNQIAINYDVLKKELKAQEKIISINIQDWNGNDLRDFEFFCKSGDHSKEIINGTITFTGSDIGMSWRLSAKNPKYYSDNKFVNPERDFLGDTGKVDIKLDRHKLEVLVREENENGRILENVILSKTEFVGKEIKEPFKISVSCKDFKTKTFDYNPSKDNSPVNIYLQKKARSDDNDGMILIFLDAGDNGTVKDEGRSGFYSDAMDFARFKSLITPNRGFKVVDFVRSGTRLLAKYEKVKKWYLRSGFIAGLIVVALVIAVGISALNSKSNDDNGNPNEQAEEQIDIHQISAYIEGDSLILDTLLTYKKLLRFEDSVIKGKLDTAIIIRQYINAYNIPELKKLSYYSSQDKFRTSISRIDSARIKSLKKELGDVSLKTLNQISSLIDTFLNKPILSIEKVEIPKTQPGQNKQRDQTTIGDTSRRNKTSIRSTNNSGSRPGPMEMVGNDVTDIASKLKNDVIKKYDLDPLLSPDNREIDKSIQLYIEFWKSIKPYGMKMDGFKSLLAKVTLDKYLKNSQLRSFLYSICQNSESFKRFSNNTEIIRCTSIKELKAILEK